MELKLKLVTLGVILLITFASVVTVYAVPPPPPTQGALYDFLAFVYDGVLDVYDYLTQDLTDAITDISDYLTNTLDPKIDDISDNLDKVSTELGMEAGKWFSYSRVHSAHIVEAWVGELARFTVSVSFYQGDANDHATIFMAQDGYHWNELTFLNPGAGEYATFSTTVVCQKILIRAGNENINHPGPDPFESRLEWAISAVGSPDSGELTTFP